MIYLVISLLLSVHVLYVIFSNPKIEKLCHVSVYGYIEHSTVPDSLCTGDFLLVKERKLVNLIHYSMCY